MIQIAEEAIPRSSENVAFAIGALCSVRVLLDCKFFSRFYNLNFCAYCDSTAYFSSIKFLFTYIKKISYCQSTVKGNVWDQRNRCEITL